MDAGPRCALPTGARRDTTWGTNAWFLGGGKAMVNALFRSAERLGVDIRYEAEVVGLDIQDGRFRAPRCARAIAR
jgi:phytoene dehydrogenase-like protein